MAGPLIKLSFKWAKASIYIIRMNAKDIPVQVIRPHNKTLVSWNKNIFKNLYLP